MIAIMMLRNTVTGINGPASKILAMLGILSFASKECLPNATQGLMLKHCRSGKDDKGF